MLGSAATWNLKTIAWKIYPSLNNYLYLSDFRSSAWTVAGLQTEPALTLLRNRESTIPTSHRDCLPAAYGTSLKPSSRFWSGLWFRCPKTERMWALATISFISLLKNENLENLPVVWDKIGCAINLRLQFFRKRFYAFSQFFEVRRSPIAILSCWFDYFIFSFFRR